MIRSLSPNLDNPAYHKAVKLRGYTIRTSVFQAATDKDAGKILRLVKPDWTQQEQLSLAKQHAEESAFQKERWAQLLDAASQETFGRPFGIFDYQISGIGREEFSEERKTQLRFAAHATTYHDQLSRAHQAAAKRRY